MSYLNLWFDSFHSAVGILSCPCCRCPCCAPEWSDQTHGAIRQQDLNYLERIENKRNLDRGSITCRCWLASDDSYLFWVGLWPIKHFRFLMGYERSAWPNDSWPNIKEKWCVGPVGGRHGCSCWFDYSVKEGAHGIVLHSSIVSWVNLLLQTEVDPSILFALGTFISVHHECWLSGAEHYARYNAR